MALTELDLLYRARGNLLDATYNLQEAKHLAPPEDKDGYERAIQTLTEFRLVLADSLDWVTKARRNQ